MVTLSLQEYDGRQLTQPEIDYIQSIKGERNRIREDQKEKALERKLLADIGMAQEAAKKSAKSADAESISNHSYILQQQQQQQQSDEEASVVEPRQPKKSTIHKPSSLLNKSFIQQDEDDASHEQDEKPSGDVSSFKPIRKRKLVEEVEEPEIEFFAVEGIISSLTWRSIDAISNLSLLLPAFGVDSSNNTIGIQAKVEKPCRGWALNISPADDKFCMDILFHFNPRFGKHNKIIMNDRIGTWGTPTDIPMRDQNQQGILATDIQLKIEIRTEGFVVFANDLFCAFFAHRRRFDQHKDLRLVLLAADDNGVKEEVVVEKIWWGRQDFRRHTLSPNIQSLIRKISSEKPESVLNPYEPRTIILEGLPCIYDLEILQGLEYAILDIMENVMRPEKVSLVPGEGLAYIRMRKPEDVPKTIEGCKEQVIENKLYPADGDISLANMRPMLEVISV